MAGPGESRVSTGWSTGAGKGSTLADWEGAAVTVAAGVGLAEQDSRSVSIDKVTLKNNGRGKDIREWY